VSERSRGVIGKASRDVVTEIDTRLKTLDEQLAAHEALLAEHERLRAARATLLGEGPSGQISQDDIANYLSEHPGSRPREIADALGLSSGRVSAHLFRAKHTRSSAAAVPHVLDHSVRHNVRARYFSVTGALRAQPLRAQTFTASLRGVWVGVHRGTLVWAGWLRRIPRQRRRGTQVQAPARERLRPAP
jgi:Winged helix-turn-helix DNA-binding